MLCVQEGVYLLLINLPHSSEISEYLVLELVFHDSQLLSLTARLSAYCIIDIPYSLALYSSPLFYLRARKRYLSTFVIVRAYKQQHLNLKGI